VVIPSNASRRRPYPIDRVAYRRRNVIECMFCRMFYIGMRLQHLKQIAGALSADHPARMVAKAVIVAEVERLHRRIWNGKAKNARKSIDRIRAVMSHFQ
jgi:hypothetical protein